MTTSQITYRTVINPTARISDLEDALKAIYNFVTDADGSHVDAFTIERLCEDAGVTQAAKCPECGDLYIDRDDVRAIETDGHCGCED